MRKELKQVLSSFFVKFRFDLISQFILNPLFGIQD